MQNNELSTVAEILFLEPEKARFYELDHDFIGLEYDGADKKRVQLHRSMPIHKPDAYICVLDMEAKEIGIIRSLDGFAPEQLTLIRKELDVRYYSPHILQILSVKEKMGYVYFDLKTQAGSRNIAVKDVSKGIRLLEDDRVVIVDIDGNRYTIDSFQALDRKSAKYLQPYLF